MYEFILYFKHMNSYKSVTRLTGHKANIHISETEPREIFSNKCDTH